MAFNFKYHQSIFKKYGLKAILFLLRSKLSKNKLVNRKITGAKYPIHLSNYSADVSTLFQIFYAKEYELSKSINPYFIVDCGANIGLSAVYYANIYPNAKIIAIEPDKSNFYFLKKNTVNYSNVVCINKAIWSKEKNLKIIDIGTGNWSLQTVETNVIDDDSVSTITLTQILDEYAVDSIDILKIDIEGAEKELFSNNYEYWLYKTKIIAIELHENIDKEIPLIFFKAISNLTYSKYQSGENLICDFR